MNPFYDVNQNPILRKSFFLYYLLKFPSNFSDHFARIFMDGKMNFNHFFGV